MLRSLFPICYVLLAVSVIAQPTWHESTSDFKSNYDLLGTHLQERKGDLADVSDFVYKKDVATFTFVRGRMLLQKYVMGRPTSAIFLGEGHVSVVVPPHCERQSLGAITGDSVVNQEFKVCVIRMADDLDLRLNEDFDFVEGTLTRPEFQRVLNAHGERFFDPTLYDTHDNYFQLLSSAYERAGDGYFFADFNRYCFSFDPDRPEEVLIQYEFRPTDMYALNAASFQRREKGIYEDTAMSQITYPVTTLRKLADLEMAGADGLRMDHGAGTIHLVVNRDSIRFVPLFLQSRLTLDSAFCDGEQVGFSRRKDFDFVGVVLPEYRDRNDTLKITMHYHGYQATYTLPFTEKDETAPHFLRISHDRDFDYVIPFRTPGVSLDNSREQFMARIDWPLFDVSFISYSGGFDSVEVDAGLDFPVTLLRRNGKSLSGREDKCLKIATDALQFFSYRLGKPFGVDHLYTYLSYWLVEMSGMMKIPTSGHRVTDDIGGHHAMIGPVVAKQWFGSAVRRASTREDWLMKAVPEYLGLLYVQWAVGQEEFFSNLFTRQEWWTFAVGDRGHDKSLVGCPRTGTIIDVSKGVWVLHMLRGLLFDTETKSEERFWKFIRELVIVANNMEFTNADVILVAERNYGAPLDEFFSQWIYGTGQPVMDVEYSIRTEDTSYFVPVEVQVSGVPMEYAQPVLVRVTTPDRTFIIRQNLTTGTNNFELGPFDSRPTDFRFNEFLSIMCKQEVREAGK